MQLIMMDVFEILGLFVQEKYFDCVYIVFKNLGSTSVLVFERAKSGEQLH